MKKLTIALAALSLAGAVQAAESWTVVNAGAYEGYKIVPIWSSKVVVSLDAATTSDFNDYFLNDSALSLTGAETWKAHYETLSGMLSTSTIADGTATDMLSGQDVIKSITFALFEDGITAGGKYVQIGTLYDESGNGMFDFTNATELRSGTLNVDAVPEPTSGLLMLVGLAGLALKRKRA